MTHSKSAGLVMALVLALSFILPSAAYADPPDWAPAWGWRAKQGDYDDGHGYKHKKKHNYEYDDDYDYDDDDDDDGRVFYRRDVVRCDSRRYDGTIGDLAGVLIDRTFGVRVDRGERCYVDRYDDRRGMYWIDPNLN